MKVEEPLTHATFVARPNRFITIFKTNNKYYKSHLQNAGCLEEL
tara:strand:+ start:40 stop:171 length:132 start_codon:yes stop_codon:yes gene_type:complete